MNAVSLPHHDRHKRQRHLDKRRQYCARCGAIHCAVVAASLAAAHLLCCCLANGQEPEIRFGTAVPPDVETIYERGLQWLVKNQDQDGTWHGGENHHGSASGNSGITGMVVMAFLASGEDPNFGAYSDSIRRALQALIKGQDTKSGFLPGSMYHHGFAMLALAEAYGVVDEEALWQGSTEDKDRQRSVGEALELAVRCAVTAQKNNQWGGWRYAPSATDADTSVSGAVLMGLLAARNAGIRVPDETIDNAIGYFQKMTSSQGAVGYSGGVGGWGGSKNLQAIASLIYAVGRRRNLDEYEAVTSQVTLNLEHEDNGYPEYFRYYMAQALFQGDFESWQRWNMLTIRQLKNLQAEDGHFQSRHGSAYGTAMSMLALALNYRFLPVYER